MIAESYPTSTLVREVPRGADWHVLIRCPGCGRVQGTVTSYPGRDWDVRLATSLVDTRSCRERGCPSLRWPSADAVARRSARSRAGSATLRAEAVADRVLDGEGRYVLRGLRLGEGPAEHAARVPDSMRLDAPGAG